MNPETRPCPRCGHEITLCCDLCPECGEWIRAGELEREALWAGAA